MRKLIVFSLVAALAILLSSVCFSEDKTKLAPQKPMMGADMMHKGMMMQQGQKEGMQPMQGMMMKQMMEKSLVATEDGGVIVLVGNKLLKYDKDLNLQKEVEIKIDTSAMDEKMMQMQEMHKKCSSMMQEMNKPDAPVQAQGR